MLTGDLISAPRAVPALAILGSAAALGGALLFQYVGGLAPCPLCMDQRWAHVAAIIALTGAVLMPGNQWVRRLSLAGGAAAYGVGGWVAGYHTGVEQKWWAGPTACSGAGQATDSLEALRAQIMAAPIVRCDEIPWELAGISMAGYNFLLSAGLCVLVLAALVAAFRSPVQEWTP